MNSKEALERFRELNKDNKILCTQEELQDFLLCGIVLKNGNNYVTRFNDKLDVKTIKSKSLDFDIDLSNIINTSTELAKEHNVFRIYCMSQRCYEIYKNLGLIITKNNVEYYQYFQNELWLVNIIN